MFDDDISKLFDSIFGRRGLKIDDSIIDYRLSERLVFDDYITYTLVLKGVSKDDIDVKPHSDRIILNVYKGVDTKEFNMPLPFEIKPDEIKVTYINGVLDIEAPMTPEAIDGRVDIDD